MGCRSLKSALQANGGTENTSSWSPSRRLPIEQVTVGHIGLAIAALARALLLYVYVHPNVSESAAEHSFSGLIVCSTGWLQPVVQPVAMYRGFPRTVAPRFPTVGCLRYLFCHALSATSFAYKLLLHLSTAWDFAQTGQFEDS